MTEILEAVLTWLVALGSLALLGSVLLLTVESFGIVEIDRTTSLAAFGVVPSDPVPVPDPEPPEW